MKNNNESRIEELLNENIKLRERIKELEPCPTDIYDLIIGDKEKKLKELFKVAPIGTASVEISGNILYANPYFCNMLGYTEDELKKLTIKDITFEEDYKEEIELINKRGANSSNSLKLEKRYYSKNGDTKWANIVFILFEDSSKVKFGLGFIEDITEKKLKDKAIKDSEAKFKSMFNGIDDSVFMHTLNPKGFNKFIEVNKIACQRYGYTREEFLQLSPLDLTTEESERIDSTVAFKKRLSEKGKATFETIHKNKSGKLFPVEVNSNIFTFNNEKLILSVVRDISQRKETEEKLQENKRRLTTLIGNLPGIAYHCKNDDFWTMDFISDAVLYITGYPKESLENNNIISYNDIIHKEDREKVKNVIEYSINNKQKFDLEYRIITSKGETKWVLEQGCAIYNKDGSIDHLEGYISDINETKIRENELIKAKEKAEESDKLKSTFLATMSHELRTPLNGIIGFSELMNKSTPPDQVESFSKNILDCGNSLLAIIEDIFDLALLETNALTLNNETFKIVEIYLFNKKFLEDLLNKSGKQNNIELVFKPENSILDIFIEGDRFKINQVLTNLIKNAVKFTNSGIIELGFYSKNNSSITFYIKDSGIGISKESQEYIFDIFRQAEDLDTRNYGGTGIGLTISRMIADAMNGELRLKSELGIGSTFYFSLPFTSSSIFTPIDDNKTKEQEQPDFSGIKILIVEDEEINLFLLESILEKYNPEIVKAENGLEAVIKFRENPNINLILMDIKMPKMNGLEATLKIREFNTSVPIIALTAYNYNKEIINSTKYGFNNFITKPFNKENLIETITDQLK